MASGTVKWFNSTKGFGFIVVESTSDPELTGDVMIHITCLRAYGDTMKPFWSMFLVNLVNILRFIQLMTSVLILK